MTTTFQAGFTPRVTKFSATLPARTPVPAAGIRFGADGDQNDINKNNPGGGGGNRTHLQNWGTLMKHACTRGLLGNIVSGTLIGGVLALLSGTVTAPITIPASIMVLFGINVAACTLAAFCMDPNGEAMQGMIDVLTGKKIK